MSDVERSAYRQPVTASGLEAIESGTLTWLDEDMYNNLNTGVLEQYLGTTRHSARGHNPMLISPPYHKSSHARHDQGRDKDAEDR